MKYWKKHWEGLLIFILAAEFVGSVSSFLSGNAGAFYQTLLLPPFSPPGWLFGLVWPVLYALMGIAAYLIYASEAEQQSRKKALILYGVQLAVNFSWSIIFFRFELLWGGLIVIAVLDFLVLVMLKVFRIINDTAAKLIVPYFIWILFATYLNLGIAMLN